MFITFIFVIFVFPVHIKCQTFEDVLDLKSTLFKDYDETMRPNIDQSEVTVVFVELSLVGMNGLNEVSEKLVTTGVLFMQWVDQNLSWDPTSYKGVKFLNVPQRSVWKPDVQLLNGLREFKQMGGDFMNVYIQSDGVIIWKPYLTFETKCPIATKYYPFDTQICNITFIPWSMENFVKIQRQFTDVNLNSLESNGEWNVLSSNDSLNLNSSDPSVTFTLILKRKPMNVVLNLIIPIILLTVLDVFTFMIPVDSGEKIGFCMTVFLSFAVFLTIVNDKLPASSDSLSILEIYLLMMLAQGGIVIVITTIQLRLYFRDEERAVPKVLKHMTKLVLSCQRIQQNVSKPEKNEVAPMDKEHNDFPASEEAAPLEISWKEVVEAMDYFFFWVSLLYLFLTTTVLCAIALRGSD